MQLGFNTNFRYREVVFHVQTEDSGRANPHVITHLFHGGNIIASVKSDYSDLLVQADLEAAVRKLMETQHKAMLKQLSRGELDGEIRARLGAEIFTGETAAGASTDRASSATDPGGSRTDGPPLANRRGGASASTASTPSVAPRPSPAPRAAASASSASSTPMAPARSLAERTAVTGERRDTSSGLARVFGERVVSEKPLDEVVLDYLVENARKRKRQPKS